MVARAWTAETAGSRCRISLSSGYRSETAPSSLRLQRVAVRPSPPGSAGTFVWRDVSSSLPQMTAKVTNNFRRHGIEIGPHEPIAFFQGISQLTAQGSSAVLGDQQHVSRSHGRLLST